jgi:hypothetical protein
VKKDLEKIFGIAFPDYKLIFDNKLNKGRLCGEANYLTKIIRLPTNGRQSLPWAIAHEYAHAYQMENSQLYSLINQLHESGDFSAVKTVLKKSERLVEGWATFASVVYANRRDERIGASLYKNHILNLLEEVKREDIKAGKREFAPYYEGLEIFERIFDERGLLGTISAAEECINDSELANCIKTRRN